MTDPIYAGSTIEIDGREAAITGAQCWGGNGPTPGSPLPVGTLVSAATDEGPVLARLTINGRWTEVP